MGNTVVAHPAAWWMAGIIRISSVGGQQNTHRQVKRRPLFGLSPKAISKRQ